ncbi:MAG: hypothetical protein K2O23_01570, partial [Anaeroplasmataceae bacterium]|nr:hypothetical protein [Anaeroplasmataceae bacterium]
KYYFTTILDKRASSPLDFTSFTEKNYEVIEDYKDAISYATKNLEEEELLVITGSLHFISEARKEILEVLRNEL